MPHMQPRKVRNSLKKKYHLIKKDNDSETQPNMYFVKTKNTNQ